MSDTAKDKREIAREKLRLALNLINDVLHSGLLDDMVPKSGSQSEKTVILEKYGTGVEVESDERI